VPIVRWLQPAYDLLGQSWLPLVGFVGLLALVLRAAARSGREAMGLGALLLVLMFYPAIQFSVRHIFYLEFIWVTAVLSLPCAVWEWCALGKVLPRFLVVAGATLGALAISYFGLAKLQQRLLTTDFSALLTLPREPVRLTTSLLPDGAAMLTVATPPQDAAMVFSTADSMTTHLPEVGIQNDVRASGERMLVTLGGRDCPQTPVRLRLVYSHRPNVWQPFDTSLTTYRGATTIFPAFYRATQNFDGILLPGSHAACTVDLFRLPLSYSLPLVLTAVLPDNWQSLPLRKGLGRYSVNPPQ
jgi:hypothetical protein